MSTFLTGLNQQQNEEPKDDNNQPQSIQTKVTSIQPPKQNQNQQNKQQAQKPAKPQAAKQESSKPKHDRNQTHAQSLSAQQQSQQDKKFRFMKEYMTQDANKKIKSINQEKQQKAMDRLYQKPKKDNFISEYENNINDQWVKVYQRADTNYSQVVKKLKDLEKKQFLQKEIQRNENIITKQKSSFNNQNYDIQQKKKQLDKINEQINKLEEQLDTGRQRKKQMEEMMKEYEKLQDELIKKKAENDSLEYMTHQRKKILLYKKKKYQQQKELMNKIETKIAINEPNYEKHWRTFGRKKQLFVKTKNKIKVSLNPYNLTQYLKVQFQTKFQNLKKHMLYNQFEIKNKKLKSKNQKKKDKKDQMKKLKEEKKKNKYKKILIRNMKKQRKNLKRKKNTFKHCKKQLVDRIKKIQKNIMIIQYILKKDQKDYNIKLKHKRKNWKMKLMNQNKKSLKKNLKEKQQNKNRQLIKRSLQQKIQKKIKAIEYQEKSLQRRDRQTKMIDEICLVISRMLYQLKDKHKKNKNEEFKRDELLGKISICSLRLEKMLAILSKKKDVFRRESVNTDSDFTKPPDFIGINQTVYNQRYHQVKCKIDEQSMVESQFNLEQFEKDQKNTDKDIAEEFDKAVAEIKQKLKDEKEEKEKAKQNQQKF